MQSNNFEFSTQKRIIRRQLFVRVEEMLLKTPQSAVFTFFLLPGNEWMFETEIFNIAKQYPEKTFLVCCFEYLKENFEKSNAPLGYPKLSVRQGKPVENVHLVYINDKFEVKNKVIEKYFSHLPELVTAALTSPRFIWADFCGHPSSAFLSTLTDDLRHGDVIFSTFMLNWRREDSVHPYLLAQAARNKCDSSESRAKVMKAHIYSRAIGNAKYHKCKVRQLDYWCYVGDTGKTPMFTSGFEVCSRT